MNTARWAIFKDFEDKKYIHKDQFKALTNYICGNINSCYSPNRWYHQEMYNYYSKFCIVKNWRKKKRSGVGC